MSLQQEARGLAPARTLLVASTGGHLKELHHLRDRVAGISAPYSWVTFDTPQARSLLAGEEVDWVPFVGGRDPLNVARNLAHARRIFRARKPEAVLSTGSAVALAYFAYGRAKGLPCHFVESAARIEGPSLSGRLMTAIPGVHLYSQYRVWADERWRFRGSVFDSFTGVERPQAGRPQLRKIVVTLGTYRGYDFSRLVRRLLEVLPPEAEVLWQTGDTDVSAFGIEGHYAIPEAELTAAMQEADVVIAHAGVGTALAAFEVGKCPLLVPRRYAFGEHVDDHQIQIAEELGERGLTLTVDADELSSEHLETAAARGVGRASLIPDFELDPPAPAKKPAARKPLQGLPGRERLVRGVRSTGTAVRRLDAARRPLPDFLIIGAQKAGTTSLYEYLCDHPKVTAATLKEVHYFDLGYQRGPSWYRAHFRPRKVEGEISGEATPYYLYHPLAPERVARDLPAAKLIVLLRDPVTRAYSHHNHERALGFEKLGFEEALKREAERLRGEEERIIREPGYRSFAHQHHSYLARSRYADQLGRWLEHFDREQLLVLSAEDLFERPADVVAECQRFLGLEPVTPADLSPRNARVYRDMPEPLRAWLEEELAADNERLQALLEREPAWA